MTCTFTLALLSLALLCLSQAFWAEWNLTYQSCGDCFEGVRPKLVSNYDGEVIPTLKDYQKPANQLPAQLRVEFYLRGQSLCI